MNAARKKPADDDDDVQKVSLEAVGPKAKEAHAAAMKESVFSREVLIAGFVAITALGTFGQMFMQYRTAEAQRVRDAIVATKVDEVADKAKAVKETLDQTTKNTDKQLDDLHKTTHETKVLVNSGSLATLQLLSAVSQQAASFARLRAEQTGKQEDQDIAEAAEKAATLAEKNVKDHEAKQAAVDAAAKEK